MKTDIDFNKLSQDIKVWASELGFQQTGITDTDLQAYEAKFQTWLEAGHHGEMDYMAKHGSKRTRPAELVPGTKRIITVRMDYLPPSAKLQETLRNKDKAYIARYALGRDYHKVLRKKLHQLADKISSVVKKFGYRAFVDSAPVLEKPLAEKSGLGWIGKNSLVLNKKAGSWFLLGELYTDLPLVLDTPATAHCGSCTACIDVCPTRAIVKPYVVDARKCIAYLTIEYKGNIPHELRPLMGNRIFGCDDCQIVCPWNKFAKTTQEKDFYPRHHLDSATLIELFSWTEEEFLNFTQGSAIRRAGYIGWLRNIAVALGNAPTSNEIVEALKKKLDHSSELVKEHVKWALEQHYF